jgi:hypothetical protein
MCVAFIFVGFVFGCCVLKKNKKTQSPQTFSPFLPFHLAQPDSLLL